MMCNFLFAYNPTLFYFYLEKKISKRWERTFLSTLILFPTSSPSHCGKRTYADDEFQLINKTSFPFYHIFAL